MKTIRVLAIILAFSGVSLQGVQAASMADATKALADAKAVVTKANANNWIWRDTQKFYKEAEAAAKGGDAAKALKLAKIAGNQATLAIEQKEREEKMQRGL